MLALLPAFSLVAAAMAQTRTAAPEQEYTIDRWEVEQGLPENSATAMVQTPDGYLWFGTFSGLVRFDGVRFTVLDPVNTPELADEGVVALHLDRSGNLWVGTLGGLTVRTASGWRRCGPADGWDGGVVRTFAERSTGDLLVTTFDGKVLEFAAGRFTTLPPPPGQPGQAFAGAADGDDRWWVTKDGSAACWDGRAWTQPLGPPDHTTDQVGCAPARDGGLWFVLGGELREYRNERLIRRRALPQNLGTIWHMLEDSRGNLWLSTVERGVCRVSPDGQARRWDSTNGIAHSGVRFVFEDVEHNLWVGTSGGGLARFRPRRVRTFGVESGLHAPVVASVWPDAAGVWAATYGGGLNRLQDGSATRTPPPAGGVPADYTQSVLTDTTGRTWVGAFERGLFCLSPSGLRPLPLADTSGGNVIALFEDSRGRIWASGGLGVSVFETGALRPYAPDQPPAGHGVRCFAEDGHGTIWASNLHGVFRLIDGAYREVTAPDGSPIGDIACIRFLPDGSAWMGSRTAGLLRWTPNRLDRIGLDQGLPARSILGIMEDARGFWWMPSSRGVVRAPRQELEAVADGWAPRVACQLIGVQDGMATVECTGARQPVCARGPDGRLWLATTKGVVSIDPEAFELNTVPPQTHIESVSFEPGGSPHAEGVADNPAARTSIPLGSGGPDHLTLPAGSRHLQVQYTATSLTAPELVRFQTMLEGLDDSWKDAGARRSEFYHDLPPGDYVFRIRAANNDGLWNQTGSRLAFTLLPHAWQTWWFTAGWVSLLAAGLVGGAWWGTRASMRRTHEHLEFVRQRTALSHLSRVTLLGELSGSLAHELNQPLTAILSNTQAAQRFLARTPAGIGELREILADVETECKRAGELISRLRLLLRKGEVVHTALNVGEAIRDVLRLLRSDLIHHGVTVDAQLDAGLPTVRADRVQLQQVMINLVVNACEAMAGAPAGTRRLSVTSRAEGPGKVLVRVSDSGPGIPPEHLGRVFEPYFTTKPMGMGLGLPLCRTILKAHDGELWAVNNAGGGASFCFTLRVMRGAGA